MNSKPPAPASRGFVLIIVLTMLVVLTLLATAVATSAERALQAAIADADRFQSELDMAGTRDTFLFLFATQRKTLAGVTVREEDAAPASSADAMDPDAMGYSVLPVGDEIRLDGTAYHGLGTTAFAAQDDRGLLSINWAPSLLRDAFFQSRGVAASEWNGLDAKRLDYQDEDDLHRLNGAEKDQYQKDTLPPPSNRPLATPLEARRILGWGKMLGAMDDAKLLSVLTLSRSTSLNLNTAPVEVLGLLPNMTKDNAARMAELRRSTPLTSIYQASQTFGLPSAAEEMLSLFAIQSGSLILWNQRSGARRFIHWTQTPLEANGSPWRIDYEVILPRGNESDQTVVGTPQTSLFSAQDPSGQHQ